jgi:hypothetical protein
MRPKKKPQLYKCFIYYFFSDAPTPVAKKCISIIKKNLSKHTRDQRTQAVK